MIAAAILLLAACGVDRGEKEQDPQNVATAATAEPAAGTYVLGSAVTAAGAIAEGAAGETFVIGGPIFFSIDVSGATTDQTIEIEWIDPRGRVFHRDRRLVRQGARYAAFSSRPTAQWISGTYRLIVVIDGRRVNEQFFSLIETAGYVPVGNAGTDAQPKSVGRA